MLITIDSKYPTLEEINGAIDYLTKQLSLNQIQLRLNRFTGGNKEIIKNQIIDQEMKLKKLYKSKEIIK